MEGPGGRTRRSAVLRDVLGDRRVACLELAFAGFSLAEYGEWVAILVYAYQRGGATESATMAVAQLLPAALAAPFLGRALDHGDPMTMLTRGYWLQALTFGGTGCLLLAHAPILAVYATAIANACAVTITRPAQAALVPGLARDGDHLTAINIVSGWMESVGVLAGPALAGVLMAIGGPGIALLAFGAVTAGSAVASRRAAVRGAGRAEPVRAEPVCAEPVRAEPVRAGDDAGGGILRGLAAVRDERGLTAAFAVLGAEYVVIGMLDVLFVVLAIDTLGLGASSAGYLSAAFGAGGACGALLAVSLIGRTRLGPPLIAAAVAWSVALTALGAWPTAVGAFALLAAAGSARSVLDVCGRTLILRTAPEGVRGRVFGLLEGMSMFGLALGSLLVPALVAIGGAEAALAGTGIVLSAVALVAMVQLHRAQGPPPRVAQPGLVVKASA